VSELTTKNLFCGPFKAGNSLIGFCSLVSLKPITATIMLEETGFGGDMAPLPDSIVNFNAAGCQYTGGFVDITFHGCNNLMFLDLDGNMFNTSIPSILSKIPKLEFLYLSDTLTTGTLSPLQGMPAIRELWVDANPGLTGQIHTRIGELTTLESLSLAYNDLTGTIPTELGSLTNLKQLWLYSNRLSGTVPTELGSLGVLKILQLEDNDLEGWVRSEICKNTEFPGETLQTLGADCHDEGFWCPCCSCCNLTECTESTITRRKDRRRKALR
jgi:hypothetical protein